MKAKTNNKQSAKKKLLPAIAMLTTSAIMLSTATYAWFTMNKEVEVTGINMTAVVPEDIQISLGEVTGGTLNEGTGTLTRSGTNTTEPANTGADTDNKDWSNIAVFGNYYTVGKLLPASSTNGAKIFFTPDATGDGSTVKETGARYYEATAAGMATLHAKTAADVWGTGDPTDTKQSAIGWKNNETKDDGYYVDIPVWFRTSAKENINLKVDAYVKAGANSTGGKLYQAVRVAILDSAATTTKDLVQVQDGAYDITGTLATKSILDWENKGSADAKAVASVSGTTGTYGDPVLYNGTDSVVTVSAARTENYGDSSQVIVRVWLEGEDEQCYNPNAGQDWTINLKFSKI